MHYQEGPGGKGGQGGAGGGGRGGPSVGIAYTGDAPIETGNIGISVAAAPAPGGQGGSGGPGNIGGGRRRWHRGAEAQVAMTGRPSKSHPVEQIATQLRRPVVDIESMRSISAPDHRSSGQDPAHCLMSLAARASGHRGSRRRTRIARPTARMGACRRLSILSFFSVARSDSTRVPGGVPCRH